MVWAEKKDILLVRQQETIPLHAFKEKSEKKYKDYFKNILKKMREVNIHNINKLNTYLLSLRKYHGL
jgi:hypothetical protein